MNPQSGLPALKRTAAMTVCSMALALTLGRADSNYDEWRMDRRDPELTAKVSLWCPGLIIRQWNVNLGAPIRFSPVVGYGRIYAGTDDGRMYALDPTGAILWSYQAGGAVSTSAAVQQLIDVPYPILWFTAEDGYLYALNAETGGLLWRLPGGASTFNSSVSYEVPRRVFYTYSNGIRSRTRAVNGVTGQLLWEGPSANISTATPLVIHDHNIVVQGLTQIGRVVTALSTADGTELWSLQSASPRSGAFTSGVYSAGYSRLYTSLRAGSVEAYGVPNQHRLWSVNLRARGPVTGFALAQQGGATEGTLLVTQDAYVWALECRNGSVRWWAHHSGNLSDATTRRTPMPAIYGNLVFLIEDGNRLVARRFANGDKVREFVLDGPVISSPAIAPPVIIVGTKAGTLYAFKPWLVWF